MITCLDDTLSIVSGEEFPDRDVELNNVMTFEWTDNDCEDTDNGSRDKNDSQCDTYWHEYCGWYDDDDFQANLMCCKCGGGIQGIVSNAYSLTSCGSYSWEVNSLPPNAPGLTANLD